MQVHASQPPWSFTFPQLLDMNYPGIPVGNSLTDSYACNCDHFIDASPSDILNWKLHMAHNTIVHKCAATTSN